MSMLSGPIKGLIRHVGRRGVILFFFGMLWFSSGQSWSRQPPKDLTNYSVVEKLVPIHVLGVVMTVLGLVMMLSSFIKMLEDVSFGFSAALSSFFGLALLATLLPGVEGPSSGGALVRGVALYFTYALLVFVVSGWPEPPPAKQEKK